MSDRYHLRYSSISCSMPVREIEEFGGPEESQANAMDNGEVSGAGGGHNLPVSLLSGEVPEPLANRQHRLFAIRYGIG